MDFNPPIIPFGNGRVLQFVMNIIPFLGVVFFNWSVFALLYSFWLETLGLSFFNAIRIAFAAKDSEPTINFGKAFRFFILRVGILLFYMIFLLVFVGIDISGKQGGVSFAMYLMFIDIPFRITILSFFFIKFLELIYRYFYLGERKTTSSEDYNKFFDTRLIVIHVVIVLGVFAFKFFNEKLGTHTGIVAFAAVFVLVKMLADFGAELVGKLNPKKEG
ncbi:MAG: hypothetical protein RI883_816 [Bacteroidota bacterium]|jgi:hypothetical protein